MRLILLINAPSAVAVSAMLWACASQQELVDELQPDAIKAAQQYGSSQFACPAATAEVLRKETIQEPQGTGWYEPPHRAEYTVAVSGCGKRATYSVACDNRQKGCIAGAVQSTVAISASELADTLQPGAVKAAQQRGSFELACSAPTAEVLRKETIQEPQGTGWYELPHHAVYTVDVLGCGKRTTYLVACDDRKTDCVAGSLQKNPEGSPRQLADELQPRAVKAAQQRGSSELECAAATTEVVRKETIQEPQTTGWYEPPHHALYTVDVSGCGKRTTYLVACDDRKNDCIAGGVQNNLR